MTAAKRKQIPLPRLFTVQAHVYRLMALLTPEERDLLVEGMMLVKRQLPVLAAVGGGTADDQAEPAMFADAPVMPLLKGARHEAEA